MEKISAVIICYNEEKNIEDCIKSILWADEIILVDGFSEDKTIETASKYNVKIFTNKWEGYAKQRDFALSKCTHNWVFSIDADERCSVELEFEIKEIMNKNLSVYGYKIPRQSFFLGKWVRHCGWYPAYQLRFFNKKHILISDKLVHESYITDGETGILNNDIIHFTVQSLKDYTSRINHYSTLQALEKKDKKVTFFGIFLRPVVAFLHHYIFKGGFLDGITGLMVVQFHVITRMLTYMKIREIQNKKDNK